MGVETETGGGKILNESSKSIDISMVSFLEVKTKLKSLAEIVEIIGDSPSFVNQFLSKLPSDIITNYEGVLRATQFAGFIKIYPKDQRGIIKDVQIKSDYITNVYNHLSRRFLSFFDKDQNYIIIYSTREAMLQGT